MTNKYDDAVRIVDTLATPELRKLSKRISSLIAMGPSKADRGVVTSLNHDDWILQGIVEYIRAAGMPFVKIETMIQSTQYDTFKVKCETVKDYLGRVGDKNAQRALLRVGLRLMHKNMTERQVNISYLTFMNWIHRLPGSISQQFPGYLESGHLALIIRGDTNVRQEPSKRAVQRKRRATVDQ